MSGRDNFAGQAGAPPASGLAGGGFRLEIQGLRAVAVLLVAIHHIWPQALPGGYVGVDVFFVISGYLITGLLLREFEKTGRISMSRFYARRIKRLLPAATVTLVAVMVASLFLMPHMHWQDTALEVLASAFYVENWWLAARAVDYMDADTAASPVQHFWSLSVEEQYYIVWPWLLIGATWVAVRLRKAPYGVCVVLLGLGGTASLAYSVWLTSTSPEVAYFSTLTRAWELSLGGGLALFMRSRDVPQPLARVAGFAGVAAIMAAGLLYSRQTPFPSFTALLPTIGAALVILSGRSEERMSVYPLLRSRPFQFFGDISYSLYLWHWPLVIFHGYAFDGEPGLAHGAAILLAATILAHASKRLIEDPVLRSRGIGEAGWKPYGLAIACLLLSAAVAAVQYVGPTLLHPKLVAGTDRPLGAAVMLKGYQHSITPSLATARNDQPAPYRQGCHAGFQPIQPNLECVFGAGDAKFNIAIVGDSHAWHWVPALMELLEPLDMRLHILTKAACPFSKADFVQRGGIYTECNVWNERVLKHLLEIRPDAVFTSASAGVAARRPKGASSASIIAAGQVELWRQLQGAGIEILAVRDTPRFRGPEGDPLKCLSRAGRRPADCVVARERAEASEENDATALAARKFPAVHYVDMNDAICNRVACDPIIGGVLVWRDGHHLTATYASTLSPVIESHLRTVLKADAE